MPRQSTQAERRVRCALRNTNPTRCISGGVLGPDSQGRRRLLAGGSRDGDAKVLRLCSGWTRAERQLGPSPMHGQTDGEAIERLAAKTSRPQALYCERQGGV